MVIRTFSLENKTVKILDTPSALKKSKMIDVAVQKVFGKEAKMKRMCEY